MTNEAATDARDTPVDAPRWGTVYVMALAMLMVTLEMSLSAVTLPSIGRELDVGSGAAKWVVLAYALPTAALAVPAGRWVDRADTRRVFLAAVAAVGLTSVLAALAPTFWVLLAARVLQGAAGAMVVALSMPVIAASVPAKLRGRALGHVATIMPIGSMAGSALGGFVADAHGWRPVFLVKIPVLLVVWWLGARLLPRGRGGLPAPDRTLLTDVLVLGGAVTALLLAFDRVENGSAYVAGVLALGAAGLAVVWTRLRSSRPIVALVKRPAFGLPLLSLQLAGTFVGLSLFLLPFFVADVLHAGADLMGLAMLFLVGGVAAGSSLSGRLTERYAPHLLAGAGGALTLAGLLSTLSLDAHSGLADLAWRLALIGFGQGVFGAPNNTAMLAATPAGMIGTGGGVAATVRTLAFTVGPAVASLAYGLGGGGARGFRTGVVVLAALQVAGVLAVAAGRAASRPAAPRGSTDSTASTGSAAPADSPDAADPAPDGSRPAPSVERTARA
ncbi:MFS transporter [Streptomyces sp. NPDC018059]|uniref:MFS transporter n=1 Tax=Streptomyces sp. NPDC018059 TaxID=3365041 RepID=UPI0037A3439F